MRLIKSEVDNRPISRTAVFICIIACLIILVGVVFANMLFTKLRSTEDPVDSETTSTETSENVSENDPVTVLQPSTEPSIDPKFFSNPLEIYEPTNRDAEVIARLLYVVCVDVKSEIRQYAVVWSILNRFDANRKFTSIHALIETDLDYGMYKEDAPILDEYLMITRDAMKQWHAEKLENSTIKVNRILPKEYMYFFFDHDEIQFTTDFNSFEYWEFIE